MSAHEVVADNIRALRQARGWSVRQLAEECAKSGVPSLTQASLSNIERRREPDAKRPGRRVTVEELVALAELFGVTPNDLFTEPVPCPQCNGTGRVSASGGAPR